MNELMNFSFESSAVRAAMVDGEPWFVATDVCSALGVQNTADALKRLDDDEKGIDSIDTLGGKQDMAVVSESGLYSLILGSRKPEAKKFKKWVTSEVLPSIRKTGSYSAVEVVDPRTKALIESLVRFDAIEQEQKRLAERNEQLERRLDQIETAQDHFTVVGYNSLNGNGSMPVKEASRLGKIAARYCKDHGIQMGEVPDPRFGTVKTYPKWVLEMVFEEDILV